MRSRKSFCNRKIIKHDIIRFWPLWALLLVGLQLRCVIPTLLLAVFGVEGAKEAEYRDILLGNGIQNMREAADPILIAVLCIIAALLVFGYLFKKKETYMLHSFPVKRGEYFRSHVLSGLIMLLIPYVITYFLTWIILTLCVENLIGIMGVTLLEIVVMTVFFYSLSCLIVMLSGNTAITLIIYGVSNVLVGGFLLLAGRAAEFFMNHVGEYTIFSGISTVVSRLLDYATPLVNLIRITGNQTTFSFADWEDIRVSWQQFGMMAWYIIPAVIFYVLAAALYQKRALERVGDVLAFPWGKSVFSWVFTICGSNIFTIILCGLGLEYMKENIGSYRVLFCVGVGCQLLGVIVCFALSKMILHRTFCFWKKFSFIQLGICVFCVLGIMFFARYSNYHITVPDGKDVKRMQLEVGNYGEPCGTGTIVVERREDIERILRAAQEMFDSAEDMPVKNDMDIAYISVLCESGGKNAEFTVEYLGEPYYRKQCEAICSVLNDSDTMMEKIFSKNYKKLREDEYTFSLLDYSRYLRDEEKDENIDATALNLHKREVMQALEADVKGGNVQLCGQKEEEIVLLGVSLRSLEDLSDSDKRTNQRDARYEELSDEEEADAVYFGKIDIPVTGACSNLWKLFQKLDIETSVVIE